MRAPDLCAIPRRNRSNNCETTMAVNLGSNIQFAHAFILYLKKTHGKLIFIGSTSRKGAKNFATYAATKGALHGFARALKEEWRGEVIGPDRSSRRQPEPPCTKRPGSNPGMVRCSVAEPGGHGANGGKCHGTAAGFRPTPDPDPVLGRQPVPAQGASMNAAPQGIDHRYGLGPRQGDC